MKMILKFYLTTLIFLNFQYIKSQTVIATELGILENSNLHNLSKDFDLNYLYNVLENKLVKDENIILTSDSDFVVLCNLEFSRLTNSNAGYLNIIRTTVKLELSFHSSYNYQQYSSCTFTDVIIANDTLGVLNKFVSSLTNSNIGISDMINLGITKHTEYFKNRCPLLVSRAKNLSFSGKFLKSINLLKSIPSEAPCFNNSKELILENYIQFKAQKQKVLVLKATMEWESKNYEKAIEYLYDVDLENINAKEVLDRINKSISKQHVLENEILRLSKIKQIEDVKLKVKQLEIKKDEINNRNKLDLEELRISAELEMRSLNNSTMLEEKMQKLKFEERKQIISAIENVTVSIVDALSSFPAKFFKIIKR